MVAAVAAVATATNITPNPTKCNIISFFDLTYLYDIPQFLSHYNLISNHCSLVGPVTEN